jgi:hypothetical protein
MSTGSPDSFAFLMTAMKGPERQLLASAWEVGFPHQQ